MPMAFSLRPIVRLRFAVEPREQRKFTATISSRLLPKCCRIKATAKSLQVACGEQSKSPKEPQRKNDACGS